MTHEQQNPEEVLIERIDGARPTWLSEKLGQDWGAGKYGGWASERDQATVYTRDTAEKLLEHPLMHVAPFCKVVLK